MVKKAPRSDLNSFQLSESEADRRQALALARLRLFDNLGRRAAWCLVVWVFCYYGLYRTIESSRGEQTIVRLAVDFIGSFRLNEWASWAVSGATVIGWWRERQGRIRERSEKDRRITELEKGFDPLRLSSELSPRGEER